ncbi:TPA: streptococcal pyrogenic exotoxin SpeJ, partial [Streptococcus pyogenes]|nr:streptococcal pyrogenic exotoxin SpeJ [Streptococcus pyogenes]
MKRLIKTIILVIIIFHGYGSVKSDSEKIKDVKLQLNYAYEIRPVDYTNCNIDYLTTHDFYIDVSSYKKKNFSVDSEVESYITTKFTKNQKVNIFGLPYIFTRYDVYYIYGGVTPSVNSNSENSKIVGNLLIDGVQQKTLINPIKIDKRIFTIQEFDFKIRQYLMQTYKIYDPNSPYIKGQLEIAINGNKHESFNLYDATSSSTRSDIFKKYKDNKTINMK